jgi:hypothetical protein
MKEYVKRRFKGTVSRDVLLLVFFMNQFPPSPNSIPLRPFQFCSKISRDIRKSRCTTGINDNGVSRTPAAKLPPVSTTLAANFSIIFASVVDTGGKFATGVNDTSGKQ